MAIAHTPDTPRPSEESRWVGSENSLLPEDEAVHRWYRFILSFPPHLVRTYATEFELTHSSTLLDPFCGTGTTLVEAKKCGISSVGIEAAPMAHFASSVKTDWCIDPGGLVKNAKKLASSLNRRGLPRRLRTLSSEASQLILADSISPVPLHRTLDLIDAIGDTGEFVPYERLALAQILPCKVGNLRFGPEVGVTRYKKEDAPVLDLWMSAIHAIAADLEEVNCNSAVPSRVILADSRSVAEALKPRSIDAVITSPPYPNEKDYTRTTRLESVILGFMLSRAELQAYKKTLVRSNTRTVYRDDDDDCWIAEHPEIHRIAEQIENRRLQLGKTSGFERMYHRVVGLYFGGMAKHLEQLKRVLRPGAQLAYVVGDQASYLRVMIRTGQLLGSIAQDLGYELERIDLFRTRPSTVTKELLREEVLILRWPGDK